MSVISIRWQSWAHPFVNAAENSGDKAVVIPPGAQEYKEGQKEFFVNLKEK